MRDKGVVYPLTNGNYLSTGSSHIKTPLRPRLNKEYKYNDENCTFSYWGPKMKMIFKDKTAEKHLKRLEKIKKVPIFGRDETVVIKKQLFVLNHLKQKIITDIDQTTQDIVNHNNDLKHREENLKIQQNKLAELKIVLADVDAEIVKIDKKRTGPKSDLSAIEMEITVSNITQDLKSATTQKELAEIERTINNLETNYRVKPGWIKWLNELKKETGQNINMEKEAIKYVLHKNSYITNENMREKIATLMLDPKFDIAKTYFERHLQDLRSKLGAAKTRVTKQEKAANAPKVVEKTPKATPVTPQGPITLMAQIKRNVEHAEHSIEHHEKEKKAVVDRILASTAFENNLLARAKKHLKKDAKLDTIEKAQLLYIVLETLQEQQKQPEKIKNTNKPPLPTQFSTGISIEMRALKKAFPHLMSKKTVNLNRLLVAAPEMAVLLNVPLNPDKAMGFLEVDTKKAYKSMPAHDASKDLLKHIAQRFFPDPKRDIQLEKIANIKKLLKSDKQLAPNQKAQLLFITLNAIKDELVEVNGKQKSKTQGRLERAVTQEIQNLEKIFPRVRHEVYPEFIHNRPDISLTELPAFREVSKILGADYLRHAKP